MAGAVVQSKSTFANADSTTLTFDSNVTAGRLLVATLETYFSAPETGGYTAVSDSLGNTWVQAGNKVFNGDPAVAIWYSYNCLGGANTVTLNPYSGSGVYFNCAVFEISGIHAASDPLHATGTNTGTGTTVTGSGLVTTLPTWVFGVMMTGATGGTVTVAPGSGWATGHEFENADATMNSGSVYKDGTSTGTYTPTWTIGSSQSWVAKGAAFLLPGSYGILPPTIVRRNQHIMTR